MCFINNAIYWPRVLPDVLVCVLAMFSGSSYIDRYRLFPRKKVIPSAFMLWLPRTWPNPVGIGWPLTLPNILTLLTKLLLLLIGSSMLLLTLGAVLVLVFVALPVLVVMVLRLFSLPGQKGPRLLYTAVLSVEFDIKFTARSSWLDRQLRSILIIGRPLGWSAESTFSDSRTLVVERRTPS